MDVFITCVAFIYGLVFGSFGNAWAWRITHNESIASGRSHCPNCNHELSAMDLIPLFSWIFLKGKCRYCDNKISIRYPVSELLLGICFLSIYLKYKLSIDSVRFVLLFFFLFVASLVDYESMELPDFLLIPAFLSSLLRLPDWKSILIGTFIVSVPVLIIVLIMDKILGKETFGGGDIKLLAVLGAHFSFSISLLLLIIACIIGCIIAIIFKYKKDQAFPFGPVLSLSALFVCIFGNDIVNCYLSLFI